MKLYHVAPNWPYTPSSGKSGQFVILTAESGQFEAYVNFVDTLNEKFDGVLIDGRCRVRCAKKIFPYLKDDGTLFVHDYNRPYYKEIEKFYDKIGGIGSLAIFKKKKLSTMRNWTHNVPGGSKSLFLQALDLVAGPCDILEIGSYEGTSLIGMLSHLPQSKAIAVDCWENRDDPCLKAGLLDDAELAFDLNTAAFKDRITKMKGYSQSVLPSLIRQNRQFDFIYVDGSHTAFNTHSDLQFAWALLKQGGVLAIDDYLYDPFHGQQPLETPKPAIDHFIASHAFEFTKISIGYRVFLQKTVGN